MVRDRVTIVDVGAAAGVSRSTVSLVLRGDPSISDTTVQRVRVAMDELGYVYNRGAASLRQSHSRVLGVVIHDLTNSVFSEIAVGVDLASRAGGFVQFIAHSADDLDHQRSIIASMREHGIAGLIVSPALGTPASDLLMLEQQGIPVVQVGRSVTFDVSTVVSDNRAGAALAVNHLAALGHRDIAFVGGRSVTETFASRLDGYHTALELNRLEFRATHVFESAPSRSGGLAATEGVLAAVPAVTAVVSFNDAVAIGLIDGVRRAGQVPGRDLSIVGFDDVTEAAMTFPALTTVSIEPQRLGSKAAEMLIGLVGSDPREARHITVPVHLTTRESTFPLAVPAT